MGLLGVFVLSRATRPLSSEDVILQIAVTLCTAYIVFVLGQETLKLSGVLACYTAGLVFAWLAPPLILKKDAMHMVWSTVEWMANTLIFLLAGLIIGSEAIHQIDIKTCSYLVIIYLVLMAVRVVVVFSLLPLVSRAGQQPCNTREAALIAWSGLRGALAIALALMVKANDDNRHTKDLFVYVSGVAALTLLVNATSVTPLLAKLEILERAGSTHKSMILGSITRNLQKQMRSQLVDLMRKSPAANMEDVVDCNSLLSAEERERDLLLQERSSHEVRMHRQVNAFMSRDARSSTQNDTMEYVRTVFLNIVRMEYWASIEAGRLLRDARYTSALLYSIDKALDRVQETGLRDWECLCMEMNPLKITLLALDVLERCGAASLKAIYLRRFDEQRVYMLTNFIDAHETAQRKIGAFLGQTEGGSGAVLPEEAEIIEHSLKSVSTRIRVLEVAVTAANLYIPSLIPLLLGVLCSPHAGLH